MCGTAPLREEGEVVWRCPNPWCPAQRIGGLLHFTGRGGVDIEGAGYAVVYQLAERELLHGAGRPVPARPGDARRPRAPTPARARRTCTPRSARRGGRPLARILNGLGIRHVGEQTAIDLATWLTRETPREEGESEEAWTARVAGRLRDASADELTAVFGIGRVVAEGIARFFADEHTRDALDRLLAAGVVAEAPAPGASVEPGRVHWPARRWS